MSQKDYRCNCSKCGHEFVTHECSPEKPATCTKCSASTQDCKKNVKKRPLRSFFN